MKVKEIRSEFKEEMRYAPDRKTLERHAEEELEAYVFMLAPSPGLTKWHRSKKVQAYAFVFKGSRDYFAFINGRRSTIGDALYFIDSAQLLKRDTSECTDVFLKQAFLKHLG